MVQSGSSFRPPGIAQVAENVYTNSSLTDPVSTLSTVASQGNTMLSDHMTFTPIDSLFIVKDISVNGNVGGTADISLVQDTFSQVRVPEPTSLALLGAGLLGMALFRRRRKAA